MKIIKNKLYAIKTCITVRTTLMGITREPIVTHWAFDKMSDVDEFVKRHDIKYDNIEVKKDKIIIDYAIGSDDVRHEIMGMNKVPAWDYKHLILPRARELGVFKLKKEYINWIEENFHKYIDRFIFSVESELRVRL